MTVTKPVEQKSLHELLDLILENCDQRAIEFVRETLEWLLGKEGIEI